MVLLVANYFVQSTKQDSKYVDTNTQYFLYTYFIINDPLWG